MAMDTLSTMQFTLLQKEEPLKDYMTRVHKEPLMAIFGDGEKSDAFANRGAGARAMRRYFNIQNYNAGGFGVVSAGGDYPATQQESEQQGYVTCKLHALTVGYTQHTITALSANPENVAKSLKDKITQSVKDTKMRTYLLSLGRGDGVVGRGSDDTTVTTLTFDQPPRLIPGDLLYSKQDSSGDGRNMGGSAVMAGVRVLEVDPDKKTILVTSTAVNADDIYYLYGGVSNEAALGVHMNGIEQMFDSSNDNFQWDPTDDSTYDHCDTYLSKTRGTDPGMNVGEVDVGGNLTVEKLIEMVEAATAVGADPANLVLLCNRKIYRVLAMNNAGYRPRNIDLVVMGTKYKVQTIDGAGAPDVPILTSSYMPDNLCVLCDKSTLFKVTAPGGWNMQTGNMWKQVSGASNNFASQYEAHYDIWRENVAVLPRTSVVGYGVTIT